MDRPPPATGRERTAATRRRRRDVLMQLKIEISPIPVEYLIEKEFLKADDEDDPAKVAAALTEFIKIVTGDIVDPPAAAGVTTSRVP